VFGCVDPDMIGPFSSPEAQMEMAKKIHAEQDQDDGLFWLNIVDGKPEIGAFSGGDFMEKER
jgi:hypothetical protein